MSSPVPHTECAHLPSVRDGAQTTREAQVSVGQVETSGLQVVHNRRNKSTTPTHCLAGDTPASQHVDGLGVHLRQWRRINLQTAQTQVTGQCSRPTNGYRHRQGARGAPSLLPWRLHSVRQFAQTEEVCIQYRVKAKGSEG